MSNKRDESILKTRCTREMKVFSKMYQQREMKVFSNKMHKGDESILKDVSTKMR